MNGDQIKVAQGPPSSGIDSDDIGFRSQIYIKNNDSKCKLPIKDSVELELYRSRASRRRRSKISDVKMLNVFIQVFYAR